MSSPGKVSGRVVVLILFSGALTLWAILFFISYRQKRPDPGSASADIPSSASFRDSAATSDSIRAWTRRLPQEWIKVTFVEGQGFVFLVPCYSSNSTLVFKMAPDTLPRLACEYCDSLNEYTVTGVGFNRQDSVLDLRLKPSAGEVKILPVRDSLLKRFPDTPFRDKLLLWIRARPKGGETTPDTLAGRGRMDTLMFVPKALENEFEVLRAEDENPEGCGPETERD